MTRDDLILVIIFVAFGVAIAVLLWAGWQPQPVISLAHGEEPCIRTTLSEYNRNYPPDGTQLNRRPADWQVCTPQEILIPE